VSFVGYTAESILSIAARLDAPQISTLELFEFTAPNRRKGHDAAGNSNVAPSTCMSNAKRLITDMSCFRTSGDGEIPASYFESVEHLTVHCTECDRDIEDLLLALVTKTVSDYIVYLPRLRSIVMDMDSKGKEEAISKIEDIAIRILNVRA
jgi:hypothetical protein